MAAENRDNGPAAVEPKRGPRCPICGKPSALEARPFCSKRCADIDLHRWLGGVYAIPEADASEERAGDHDSDEA